MQALHGAEMPSATRPSASCTSSLSSPTPSPKVDDHASIGERGAVEAAVGVDLLALGDEQLVTDPQQAERRVQIGDHRVAVPPSSTTYTASVPSSLIDDVAAHSRPPASNVSAATFAMPVATVVALSPDGPRAGTDLGRGQVPDVDVDVADPHAAATNPSTTRSTRPAKDAPLGAHVDPCAHRGARSWERPQRPPRAALERSGVTADRLRRVRLLQRGLLLGGQHQLDRGDRVVEVLLLGRPDDRRRHLPDARPPRPAPPGRATRPGRRRSWRRAR